MRARGSTRADCWAEWMRADAGAGAEAGGLAADGTEEAATAVAAEGGGWWEEEEVIPEIREAVREDGGVEEARAEGWRVKKVPPGNSTCRVKGGAPRTRRHEMFPCVVSDNLSARWLKKLGSHVRRFRLKRDHTAAR